MDTTTAIHHAQLTSILNAVARRAQATYPDESARILRGVALAWDVDLHANWSATVHSGDHAYEVQPAESGGCPCKDAKHSAPGGRCKHKWAANIYRKVLAQFVAESELFEIQHTVPRRDEMAQAGDLAALVCNPEWRLAREASGHSVTEARNLRALPFN